MSEEMTRKEAIKILKSAQTDKYHGTPEQLCEAWDMAIASLETDEAYNLMYEQPEFCKDCIEREYTVKYVEEFANNEYVSEDEAETIYLIAEGVRHIPSVTPKSEPLTECEDCISRENALRVANNEYRRGWHNAICKALKEEYDIHCDEGNFRVIQEETLIGLGMSEGNALGETAESFMSTIPSVYPKIDEATLHKVAKETMMEIVNESMECKAEDCISRQAVIDTIEKWVDGTTKQDGSLMTMLKKLQSVYPKIDEATLHKVAKETMMEIVNESMECKAEDCISRENLQITLFEKCNGNPNYRINYHNLKSLINKMPSVYPKSDNSEDVVLSFSKGTLKYSCKDYVVYKKDWFRSHYGAEIDIMCGDKQYLNNNSVLEDIKAEIKKLKEEPCSCHHYKRGIDYCIDVIDKHISRKETDGSN